MNAFLSSLLTFVLVYKYAAIFLVTFLSGLGVPVPAASVQIASGFFAAQGYLDFSGVCLAALSGSVIGDHAGYWLARLYGVPILNKIGLRRFLSSRSFKNVERHFQRHPLITTFVTRFTLTPFGNILAGLFRFSYGWFTAVDALGEVMDVILLAMAGVIFGDDWASIERVVGNAGLLMAALALLAVFLAKRYRKPKKAV